jgi:hypothetical protein
MMNTSLLLAAALLIGGARTELPPDQVQAQFEKQCVDGRWSNDNCPALRAELELQFYEELQQLALHGEVDRAALQTAARAHLPMLAAFGLRKLGKIASQEDRDAALAAVEHPAPAVRALAKQMLEVQDDRWRKGPGVWWRGGTRNGFAGLVPDVVPSAAQLGIAPVSDNEALRYRYFASTTERERRLVFTTKLTPDQALALLAKGGKIVDGTKLPPGPKEQEALGKSMAGVQKEIQDAMARGDMKAVGEISQRINKQMTAVMPTQETMMLRPVAEFSAAPAAVRYVQVPTLDKGHTPVTAAASREESMGGETVVVIQY